MQAATVTTDERLHRRALRLEWFTVSWNVIGAAVAFAAGVTAGRSRSSGSVSTLAVEDAPDGDDDE